MLDSVLNDVFVVTKPTITDGRQRVPVTGRNLRGGDTGTTLVEDITNQQVELPGTRIKPVVDAGEGVVEDITNQRVELPGSRIKPVNGGEGVSTTLPTIPTETNDEGQIEVIGKRITPVRGGEDVAVTTTTPTTPTTPVTPTTTTPSVPTSGPKTKTPTAYRPFTPIPEAQAQQPFRPGLADVFYGKGALEFGAGAASMADVADFQGRKAQARRSMELALEGAGGENQADDAYERLISLAQESPESTVEELMKIIEGGQRG
jgi:hypothetical protein